MYAIRVEQYGGPEVMQYKQLDEPKPGAGQALIKLKAIGINFIDVYNRTGRYNTPLPFTPGQEAAGVVEAIGPDVTEVKVGDRVAYTVSLGQYAEYAVVPAWALVPLPEKLDFRSGAAAMLQGLTAQYLMTTTYPVKAGEMTLVHAGAGGVGLLLTQMIKRVGGKVISTVSTAEKAQLAREAGADEVIIYTESDFESEVKRLTEGKGVSVVYDSVGKTTFDKSLNCLRPRGYMVLYGASSGAPAPIDPAILNPKGSLFLTRPSLFHYAFDRASTLERAGDVLNQLATGVLKLRMEYTYPLKEAAQAHRDLEGRATTGKVLLMPE